MSIPYPTNHKRVAVSTPDFSAIDRTILEGRASQHESDNPYLFKTAEWIAWQYGWSTRDVERVSA